jgi:MFS transporter, Spinster family, sphingosine-1-phosphate transporter
MVSGIIGVPLGATLAQKLRVNYPRADPLICATGLLISAPLLFGASLLAASNSSLCFFLVFLGEVALNLNWSIVADILLVSHETCFYIFLHTQGFFLR